MEALSITIIEHPYLTSNQDFWKGFFSSNFYRFGHWNIITTGRRFFHKKRLLESAQIFLQVFRSANEYYEKILWKHDYNSENRDYALTALRVINDTEKYQIISIITLYDFAVTCALIEGEDYHCRNDQQHVLDGSGPDTCKFETLHNS